MSWDVLGHLGLLALWAACGLLPWCVLLVARRGRGALTALPFAIAGGVAGGLLVVAFAKDVAGLAISLVVAMTVGAAVCVGVAVTRRAAV